MRVSTLTMFVTVLGAVFVSCSEQQEHQKAPNFWQDAVMVSDMETGFRLSEMAFEKGSLCKGVWSARLGQIYYAFCAGPELCIWDFSGEEPIVSCTPLKRASLAELKIGLALGKYLYRRDTVSKEVGVAISSLSRDHSCRISHPKNDIVLIHGDMIASCSLSSERAICHFDGGKSEDWKCLIDSHT